MTVCVIATPLLPDRWWGMLFHMLGAAFGTAHPSVVTKGGVKPASQTRP